MLNPFVNLFLPVLGIFCNSSAIKYSVDCAGACTQNTGCRVFYERSAFSYEKNEQSSFKYEPQSGAGCVADAFMNDEG